MSRLARVVIPGLAHHVTQRGNGRQKVFFSDADYALYLKLITESCAAARVACLGFCLMPNHLHLILVPKDEDGLRAALSKANRAYAGIVNARRKTTGHFWQGRYGSVPMDDAHLHEALRYVLMNPVKAKLVQKPADWRWSSARAYLRKRDDGFTAPRKMSDAIGDVRAFLGETPDMSLLNRILAAETIGRPAASPEVIQKLEKQTGRKLLPEKRGPKPNRPKATKSPRRKRQEGS
jgi:putative transposase